MLRLLTDGLIALELSVPFRYIGPLVVPLLFMNTEFLMSMTLLGDWVIKVPLASAEDGTVRLITKDR